MVSETPAGAYGKYLEAYQSIREKHRAAERKASDLFKERMGKATGEFQAAITSPDSDFSSGDPQARYDEAIQAARASYAVAVEKAHQEFRAAVKTAQEKSWSSQGLNDINRIRRQGDR